MKISIIAACDQDRLIGVDGKLPWHIPADLQRFQRLTTGHAVIMGRGTFDSLGRKTLPNRLNVVITRNPDFGRNREGAIFVNGHAEALKACFHSGHEEVFIIGGESIYQEALTYADRIYLTQIFQTVKGGGNRRYFPSIPRTSVERGYRLSKTETYATHAFMDYKRLRYE